MCYSLGVVSQKDLHETERRGLRPWFLVASLILTWLVGMQGMTAGCHWVSFLRGGSVPDTSVAVEEARNAPNETRQFQILSDNAEAQAIAETRERAFPLAVAGILLSGLLVVGSALALAGRPGSPRLLIQALVANATLAVVGFALSSHMRSLYVSGLADSARELAFVRPETFAMRARVAVWARFLIFDVGAMVMAGAALFTRRSKAFYELAARAAAERRIDDEDDI